MQNQIKHFQVNFQRTPELKDDFHLSTNDIVFSEDAIGKMNGKDILSIVPVTGITDHTETAMYDVRELSDLFRDVAEDTIFTFREVRKGSKDKHDYFQDKASQLYSLAKVLIEKIEKIQTDAFDSAEALSMNKLCKITNEVSDES